MFVVEIGSVLTTLVLIQALVGGAADEHRLHRRRSPLWLWFTVLFANFAEAMAEARGKAQADTLRAHPHATRRPSAARRRRRGRRGRPLDRPAQGRPRAGRGGRAHPQRRRGDRGRRLRQRGGHHRRVGPGAQGAGHRHPQLASPAARRSSATGCVIRITADPGETFLDRMIALVEGAARQKTPNEIALSILLAGLTIIFLLAVGHAAAVRHLRRRRARRSSILIALLVCLIPTTIGGLLSAIGIAGMDRAGAAQRAGDVRPGGRGGRRRRHAAARQDRHDHLRQPPGRPSSSRSAARTRARAGRGGAASVSLADETPEGKSHRRAGRAAWATRADGAAAGRAPSSSRSRAETRMSGVRLDGTRIMKGAVDAVVAHARRHRPGRPARRRRRASPREGGTPLAVADDDRAARRRLPQGHRQAGHARALRRAAPDGHPHHHGHRRQPADGRDHRRARPASTTSSPRPSRRTRSASSARSRPRATWWR